MASTVDLVGPFQSQVVQVKAVLIHLAIDLSTDVGLDVATPTKYRDSNRCVVVDDPLPTQTATRNVELKCFPCAVRVSPCDRSLMSCDSGDRHVMMYVHVTNPTVNVT